MPSDFGYRGDIGPTRWGSLNSDWSVSDKGEAQSPIDVSTAQAVYSPELAKQPLALTWCNETSTRACNNGKQPVWNVEPSTHVVRGGPLSEDYELVQFHIHFSDDRSRGSEHSIDGQFYPAEIHFVHYKKSYGSFQNAVNHTDGLAVVGAFIDVDDNSNLKFPAFDEDLQHSLPLIETIGKNHTVPMRLDKYQVGTDNFYTYPGSLTTPGCLECVVWLLMKEPLYISPPTYELMKKLESSEGGCLCTPGNFRPVQPTNSRRVLSSFV